MLCLLTCKDLDGLGVMSMLCSVSLSLTWKSAGVTVAVWRQGSAFELFRLSTSADMSGASEHVDSRVPCLRVCTLDCAQCAVYSVLCPCLMLPCVKLSIVHHI